MSIELYLVESEKTINNLRDKIDKIETDLLHYKKIYYDLADAVARQSNSPEHLCSIARDTRAENARLQKENERLTNEIKELL